MFDRLRLGWEDIKIDLIEAVDKDYGIYDGTTFKSGTVPRVAPRRRHRLAVDRDRPATLSTTTRSGTCPSCTPLAPLRELRHAVNDLRPAQLAVGRDGRNRAALFPFGARTGRNTPSANRFIFGLSVWIRGLIRPELGRALAYIDWSAQEVAIAAALSGDGALLEAVQSGDPYLAFAKRPGWRRRTPRSRHGQIRDHCKACVLGSNYGMGAASLAYRIGCERHPGRADCSTRCAECFRRSGSGPRTPSTGRALRDARSVFGWRCHVGAAIRPTALRNYPMQANGAEMLRLACSIATENGVEVCAPIHDALLIEADELELDDAVDRTRQAMREASSTVLGGSRSAPTCRS